MDPLVNISVPHLKVGEWKVEDVVKQGEDKIEFEKVLGYHQHNHAGLGSIKQTEVPAKLTHDYRKLVSDKVPDMQEERYFAKADALPSPTNLKSWHITTEADCSLCSVKVCTTAHVLSGLFYFIYTYLLLTKIYKFNIRAYSRACPPV